MKNRIKSLIIISAVSISTFAIPIQNGFVLASESESESQEESTEKTAPAGTTIEGTDVSGMTSYEISEAIEREIDKYNDVEFLMIAESESITTPASELKLKTYNSTLSDWISGYGSNGNLIERYMAQEDIDAGRGKDFSLDLVCDIPTTKSYLEENAANLTTPPVNNNLKREDGEFIFVEGKPGTVVDYESSAAKISDFILKNWNRSNANIDLDVVKEEPKGSREELAQVKDVLGSCSTSFATSGTARASNVRNGTSKLNQSLIFPGEEFSVSTNLESRNEANGYLPAPSYENGTTVDTYGGGVCQISTTLYNAVIRAELEIVERSPHSMVVSYVKPSMDAAISEGSKDFIFRNNLNYPVYIEGYTSGMTLYFNIYGKEERSPSRSVSFESEILSETEPGEKFVTDPTLPFGSIVKQQSAHRGYTAKLWKIVKENGKEISRDVFNSSTYRVGDTIYGVGTMGAPDPGAIAAAVATQDRGAIEASVGGFVPAPTPVPDAAPVTPDPADNPSPQPAPEPAPEIPSE